MTHADLPQVRVRSSADLLAAVPYLLGFHPVDSLVVVGVRAGQLVFGARIDLPEPDAPPGELGERAAHLAAAVANQRVQAASVIGYGPAERVDPGVHATRAALVSRDLKIFDVLRVTGDRYWSYTCTIPGCCALDGTPFDLTTSPVAAAFTFAGEVALPDRKALVRRVAPVGGLTRVSMRQATQRAEARLLDLIAPAPDPVAVRRVTAAAGARAVRETVARHRAGGTVTDDEAAWLTLLLTSVEVRDLAWRLVDEPERHIDLWLDVTRRAEPDLVAAPASLLAFAAWRAGQGALAGVAVARALRADPAYSLALLLDEALAGAVSPSTLDGWPDVPRAGRRRARRNRRWTSS